MRLRQRPGLTTRLRGLTGPALILCLAMAAPARAAGLDLHWLWDDRCAECHGHSSEFARRLTWRSGELVLAHPIGDPLHFLRHHYPPADEVE